MFSLSSHVTAAAEDQIFGDTNYRYDPVWYLLASKSKQRRGIVNCEKFPDLIPGKLQKIQFKDLI